jgi:hypothetical protein
MEGGAETGFRHVEPKKYKIRLMQCFGKGAKVAIQEVKYEPFVFRENCRLIK